MPSATFSLSGTDNRRNSGQSMIDESDYEDLERNHELNDSSSRHYWLGKLVFAHLLAEAVIRDTPMQKSGDSLDAALMEKMTSYPYSSRIRHLASLSPGNTLSGDADIVLGDFRTLVTKLGAIYDTGDAQTTLSAARVIESGLQGGRCPEPSAAMPLSENSRSSTPRAPDSPGTPTGSQGRVDIELPRYTTALKEYTDCSDSTVEWKDEQISVTPLCWKITAVVDGVGFSATAGNKKEAKHLASRQACESLAIVF